VKQRSFLTGSILVLGIFLVAGCAPKKKLAIDEKPTDVTEEVNEDATADLAAGDMPIGQDWSDIAALSVINFDYDSATLSTANRDTLKTNVATLKKLPSSVSVRVEGHCDDRGTVEYNIALGQRRANAVRSYYVTAGIGKNRIDTISFGEERPICTDATDDCWARNRRGATKVKNKENIIFNPNKSTTAPQ
jgi:peptidoglycan-associated lipoprotein